MPLPRIAIVGRPNVGKSSLLNTLAGRRVSIVDPTAGVTRDRVSTLIEVPPKNRKGANYAVELVDTGGYGIEDHDNLTALVERQIENAISEADLILFVIDAQDGVLPLDETVARLLRTGNRRRVPVLLVANKTDAEKHEAFIYESVNLGFGEPVPMSAITKHNLYGLYEAIHDAIDLDAFDPGETNVLDPGIKLAIVGKRNAGKSTLVNALAGGERVIVSEVEGTTRDSIDVRFEVEPPEGGFTDGGLSMETGPVEDDFEDVDEDDFSELDDDDDDDRPSVEDLFEDAEENDIFIVDETSEDDEEFEGESEGEYPEQAGGVYEFPPGPRVFTAIDTAGVRKKKSLNGDIEYYAMHRALRSVRRADVCLLVLDATVKASQVDHQLVAEILRHNRPCIIVINKWDIVEQRKGGKQSDEDSQAAFAEYLDAEFKQLRFAPIVFLSAKNQDGLPDVLAMAENLFRQSRHRVSTGELNRVIEFIMNERQPRSRGGKRAKVFYASQIDVNPPTIVMQVNDAEVFDNNYTLFFLNRLRDHLPYAEVPIKLIFRGKEKWKNRKV